MRPDAWTGADVRLDESSCPICLSETCEGGHDDRLDLDHHHPEDDPAPTLEVKTATEVINEPEPVVVVDGIAYAGRVSVLAAEPAAGKTFVLLDLSGHVNAGLRWHGRDVATGSVVYLSFEADALGKRLSAMREIGGQRLDHLHIVRASDPISPLVDRDRIEVPSRGEILIINTFDQIVADVADTNRPPVRLVIVDTIRASLSGSEDSSENVSAYLRAARAF